MFKTSIIAATFAFALAIPAEAGTRFGSKFLDREPTPPAECDLNDATAMCSFVMVNAHQNVGKEKAPRDGKLQKIRIRSCTPGSFVLQFARADLGTNRAKVTRSGPLINYDGDSANCNGGPYTVETFDVSVRVKKGERLAVAGTNIGFIYNASSGDSMKFVPPLRDGGTLRTETDGDGILLIQAEYVD
jgi:hypothetical protein